MPESEAAELARKWLEHARRDLRAAREAARNPAFSAEHACWHAQQAAEKAIKSVLVAEQIEFPFTHDLVRLRELVPPGRALHEATVDLRALSRWGVETRYPGQPSPTGQAAAEATEMAVHVVELVERDFEGGAAE